MNSRLFIIALWCAVLTTGSLSAQESEALIDNFGDWSAFKETEDGNAVCYIGSVPEKEEGDYTKRGETFMLVSHRPSEGRLNEVSITAGYTYKESSEVDVTIGGHSFALFTDGNTAWAWDKDTDQKLVSAMRAGSTMVVKGISSRGTATTDTYSLKGVTAAWKAINTACGVK